MAREAVLPGWASVICLGKFELQAAEFYPEILAELDVAEEDIDQYWLETVRQIARRDLQMAIAGTDLMPPKNGALMTHTKDSTKAESEDGVSKYAQVAHPLGLGPKQARRDFKVRYQRLRGVPA